MRSHEGALRRVVALPVAAMVAGAVLAGCAGKDEPAAATAASDPTCRQVLAMDDEQRREAVIAAAATVAPDVTVSQSQVDAARLACSSAPNDALTVALEREVFVKTYTGAGPVELDTSAFDDVEVKSSVLFPSTGAFWDDEFALVPDPAGEYIYVTVKATVPIPASAATEGFEALVTGSGGASVCGEKDPFLVVHQPKSWRPVDDEAVEVQQDCDNNAVLLRVRSKDVQEEMVGGYIGVFIQMPAEPGDDSATVTAKFRSGSRLLGGATAEVPTLSAYLEAGQEELVVHDAGTGPAPSEGQVLAIGDDGSFSWFARGLDGSDEQPSILFLRPPDGVTLDCDALRREPADRGKAIRELSAQCLDDGAVTLWLGKDVTDIVVTGKLVGVDDGDFVRDNVSARLLDRTAGEFAT